MFWARAPSSSFATFGTDATQRGRRSLLQVCLTISRTRRALVFESSLTAFKAGAGGAVTEAHSSTTVWALSAVLGKATAIAAMAAIAIACLAHPETRFILKPLSN